MSERPTATLAALLAAVLAAPVQAQDEVELYARCTLNGAVYELGQRRDAFDSSVARRMDGGGWTDLILRHGWLMHSPEVAAHWQDGERTLAVAYRPGPPGQTAARFAWVLNARDRLEAGHGEGGCEVLREHSTSASTLIPGEGGGPAGDTLLSRCELGTLRFDFSTNAAADYITYWQRGDEAGQVESLVNYVARNDRRRGFAFDDGLGLYVVGHSAEGGAAAAFVAIGATTLASGQASGTCEVFE